MPIPTADQIEAACGLVDYEFEKTRDGRRGPLAFRDNDKLAAIIRNLCAGTLHDYISEEKLTEEYKRWRRKQNVAETYGEFEGEERGTLDDIAAPVAIDASRAEAAVLAKLIAYLGEEKLFSRKIVKKRTKRHLKSGESAHRISGGGSATIAGETIEWLNFATAIRRGDEVVTIIPDHWLFCVSGRLAYMWRYVMAATEKDAFRMLVKITSAAALFQNKVPAHAAAEAGVSRAIFSYHQRKFADQTIDNGGHSNFPRLKNLRSAG